MRSLNTGDIRKNMVDILERVYYTGEMYIVERKGKEFSAIVPVYLTRTLKRHTQESRNRLRQFLLNHVDEHADLSEEEIMDLANELVQEVRVDKWQSE